MDIVNEATRLRKVIERLATSLDDDSALETPALFPNWSGDGVDYIVDDRVRYNNILYKVLQNHTSQLTWAPADAPSLFAKVLSSEESIPVWEQPDSTNAYMIGDRVYYPDADGNIYESLIDNNIWSPVAYPAGWKLINN